MKHLTLKEMERSNKKWFDKFQGETDHKSTGYYQTIENFLKFNKYKDKPFDTFTRADVDDYILTMWQNGYKSGRTDVVVAIISSFKNFLIRNCSFPSDFLSDILSLQVNEDSASDSIPFSLLQLHYIREYNGHNISDEYIFEIYFQLGVDKKDLSVCVPQNADRQQRCFRLKDKIIRYNEMINQLIDKITDLDELEMKIQNVDYHYFEKVTSHLVKNFDRVWKKERTMRYSDILRSHEVYMIRCPNPSCQELSENIKQNWVLVKTEIDSDYRLVCSQCKGNPYEH